MTYMSLFIGGVIGGILRYTLSIIIPTPHSFPLGILLINLFGSFVLGLFYGVAETRPMKQWLRIGLSTGVIGAFTTFSTFCTGADTLGSSHLAFAAIYVLISIIGGPVLAFAGDRVIFSLNDRRKASKELSV